MNNIVQLDFNDLQTAIKNCFRESIEEVKNLPIQPEKSDRCNFKEALEITGLKQSAIYKMTMRGEIPHQKFGKRLVFSRKDLDVWINKRTVRKQSYKEIASLHLAKTAEERIRI